MCSKGLKLVCKLHFNQQIIVADKDFLLDYNVKKQMRKTTKADFNPNICNRIFNLESTWWL